MTTPERFSDSQVIMPSSHGNPVVLETVALNKSFTEADGTQLHVLKDINLAVHAGEKIAIVGASGSGKSTLLHLMGGLDAPSSGQVLINDNDVSKMSESARCRLRNNNLGFIYQFHHLLPEFTAQENVAMPALVRGTRPSQALNKADILLEKVGMTRRLHHKP
ncbi:MAG: ATP-binding cassette domain-containing protein, partial [Gammaproteobacteria bacterium]|nr:ATP-binding cassette domain-containing protein [Gammaproteobacteria bacterium]